MSKYPLCDCKLFISQYNPKCPIHGDDTVFDKKQEQERKKFWDEMDKKVKRELKNLEKLSPDAGENVQYDVKDGFGNSFGGQDYGSSGRKQCICGNKTSVPCPVHHMGFQQPSPAPTITKADAVEKQRQEHSDTSNE